MSSLSEREKEIRVRLRDDYPHYAERCLKIRPKDPRLGNVPLVLNKAQRYAHDRFEKQREETGKVRALVLKGRQQGLSTNIGGRFYHRVTHSKGIRCFILTHEQDATDNLFGMVERFHDNCPAIMRPHTGASNAKELYFDKLDSGYAVGTAGSKAVGRSQTIQLFHGSEVAFWPNAPAHFAGVVQAVPDLPGTEIILESTANGLGGEFHERWQQAEAGLSDYIAIFIPWFWQDEYRRAVPKDFKPSEDELKYMEVHGLDMEQIVWRRAKMAELKDPMLFKQEYPATAAEAFQSTGHDSYIKPELILKARKANITGIGPLILGADPSRFGNDRFSVARRQGRKVEKVESRQKLDNVAGANWLKQITDEEKPARGFIDVGGQGAGVFDILKSWGYAFDPTAASFDRKAVWVPVDFGGSPQQRDIYLPNGELRPGPWNRRAEMWMRSREWLEEVGGADIPDLDGLQADACGPGYHYNTNSYLLLESKEHMRDVRKLRSPDEWDAVALTFAEPVAANLEPVEWTFGSAAPGFDWMSA